MRTSFILILALLATGLLPAGAQVAPGKYWVQFTDKSGTPYTISRPGEFLSERAIARRNRYGIPVTEQDLPVDPAYLDSIRSAGASVLNRSKWFNAATIATSDTTVLERIRQFGFVRQLKSVRSLKSGNAGSGKFGSLDTSQAEWKAETDTTVLQYGQASRQIGMLNGHILHNQGFQGQGMVIAVLDGGFRNVHTNFAFDTLRSDGRILGTWDFVNHRQVAWDGHAHGAQVLSILTGNLPGRLVGSAPKASYYLLITEDSGSEYLIEEDNWVSGAEFADSVGADLINSSLGYSVFDDPAMDHTFADMDGNTTRVTIAADLAARKGILVCSSAGNEGNKVWHYITAPADADSILTVGATDSLGKYAYFSSTGPTPDRRIKPNVAGQGSYSAFVNTDGSVSRGSGTSFSSPLVCGLAACLWQANRSRSPIEIIRAIEASASQATSPDSLIGYGLPDFGKALFLIQGIDPVRLDDESLLRIYPNPFEDRLTMDFYSHDRQEIGVRLLNSAGQLVFTRNFQSGYTSINHIEINEFGNLPAGVYFLSVTTEKSRHLQRVVKAAR